MGLGFRGRIEGEVDSRVEKWLGKPTQISMDEAKGAKVGARQVVQNQPQYIVIASEKVLSVNVSCMSDRVSFIMCPETTDSPL
jgi:hypothetical protein